MQILEMKSQEVEIEGSVKDYQQRHTSQDDAYTQWHKKSGPLDKHLGEQRSITVDAASKMRTWNRLTLIAVIWNLLQCTTHHKNARIYSTRS
jgi:hypothetical protein